MAWTAEEAKANAAKAAAARAAKKAGATEGETVAKKAEAGASPLVQGAIAIALAAAVAFVVGKVLRRRSSAAAVPALEPLPPAAVPAAQPVAFEPGQLAEPVRLPSDYIGIPYGVGGAQ